MTRRMIGWEKEAGSLEVVDEVAKIRKGWKGQGKLIWRLISAGVKTGLAMVSRSGDGVGGRESNANGEQRETEGGNLDRSGENEGCWMEIGMESWNLGEEVGREVLNTLEEVSQRDCKRGMGRLEKMKAAVAEIKTLV